MATKPSYLDDIRVARLREELGRLMKEQTESLEEQAFIPIGAEQMRDHEQRLRRIREISAELIALWSQTLRKDAASSRLEGSENAMNEKAKITLAGKVKKIIERPSEPKKAEILVTDADPLYQEIRVENTLEDAEGKKVELKPGAEVDVNIEADPKATKPKVAE